MTTPKLPSDLARAKLTKRAQQQVALTSGTVPKELRKTPSQKRSESGRKKYLKRAGVKVEPQLVEDCTGCPQNPCGKKILACEAPTTRYQCKHCGCLVICYRVEPRPEYCVPCGERRKK